MIQNCISDLLYRSVAAFFSYWSTVFFFVSSLVFFHSLGWLSKVLTSFFWCWSFSLHSEKNYRSPWNTRRHVSEKGTHTPTAKKGTRMSKAIDIHSAKSLVDQFRLLHWNTKYTYSIVSRKQKISLSGSTTKTYNISNLVRYIKSIFGPFKNIQSSTATM